MCHLRNQIMIESRKLMSHSAQAFHSSKSNIYTPIDVYIKLHAYRKTSRTSSQVDWLVVITTSK